MSGPISRWMLENTHQGEVPKTDKPGAVTDWMGQANPVNKLRTSVQMSDPTKADGAARVKFLQEKTGLPPDLISRNPDEVAKRAIQSDFDPEKFSAAYPETAKWLSEQPEHASVALEDLSHLGHIERSIRSLKRGWQIGREEAQVGDFQYKDMESHNLSTADKNRLASLEADVKREPGGIGFWDTLVYKTSKMFGQLSNALPEMSIGASTGAAGAATGVAVGAAAGVTIAAAPLVLTGVAAGAAVGLATSIFKTSAGQTYTQMKQVRGANGEQIDDGTARAVSLGVGAASASLMVGGAEVAYAPFRAAGQRLFASAAKDALTRPTMRLALQNMGTSYAKAMAGGTSIMALQEIANITGEEIAKIGSVGNFETVLNSPAAREQAVKRIGKAIEEGAEAMVLAALPGAAFHGLSTGYKARIADRNAGYFKALGEGVEGSKTFDKLPSGIQRLVEQQTRDGPLENVYVPAEFWNGYWQKKGEDPGAMAERVLGDKKQWQDATDHGGDIQIPTGKYATTIAPSEHNAVFSKELRRSPLEMSSEEAKDAVKNEEKATAPTKEQEEARQKHEESADRVAAEVHAQLLAAEVDPHQAADYTAIYRAVFSTMGERTGQTPEELFKKYGLQIAKGEFKEGEGGLHQQARDIDSKLEAMRQLYGQITVADRDQLTPERERWHTPVDKWTNADLVAQKAKYERLLGDQGYADARLHNLLLEIDNTPTHDIHSINKLGVVYYDALALRRIEVEQALREIGPLSGEFEQSRNTSPYLIIPAEPAHEGGSLPEMRMIVSPNVLPDEGPWRVTTFTKDEEGWHPSGHDAFNTKEEADAHLQAEAKRLKYKDARFSQEFFQSPLPPGFYSAAERLIEEKMPNRASVEDVRNILKNVKAEERKWLSLDAQVDAWKGIEERTGTKVSKNEVMSYLRANRLQIEEVNAVYTGINEHELATLTSDALTQYAQDWADNIEIEEQDTGAVFVKEWGEIPTWASESLARRWVLSQDVADRYYTEEGSFRNWASAELAEIMSNNYEFMKSLEEETREGYEGDTGSESPYEQYTLPGGENYRELLFKLPAMEGKYESQHFENQGPVFAHARLKDRVDADGARVLFIEEIQSDWHQRGREHGYAPDSGGTEKDYYDAHNRIDEAGADWQEILGQEFVDRFYALQDEYGRDERGAEPRPPDAPFRNTWHEFVFKRLLREAAEKGYDKVAWTTGEQQNARYGLEKVVDRLTYDERTGRLEGFKDPSNESFDAGRPYKVFTEIVPKEKLGNYLGKEVAVKLMTKEEEPNPQASYIDMATMEQSRAMHRVLEGEELKVGGSGMRGFYDDILPRFANKFGKKFGAKVEDTQVGNITAKFERVYRTGTRSPIPNSFWVEWSHSDGSTSAQGPYKTEEEALSHKDDAPPHDNGLTVHGVTITPELKRSALANEFALFQRGNNEPLGRIRIGDQVSIDMFAKADFSTFVHESGHFFMQVLSDATDEQSRADHATVRTWLGVEGEGPLTREQHEMFARGFEKYMAEGRAPVSALQRVFTRFKTWMMAVYAHLRDLNVDLTEDVRSVFDRMLASEADIKAEQTRQPQLFETLKDLKLPDTEAKAYTEAVERAKLAASEAMAQKIMMDHAREQSRVFAAEREQVRASVAEELTQHPGYRARALLEDGTLPGGAPLPEGETPFKLNTDDVKSMGHDLPGLTSRDPDTSLHPDMAADLLGFGSGEEMLRTLSNLSQPDQEINKRTNAIMRGKKTQIQLLTATEVPTEAMKAVHTEKRAELLRKELQILAAQELPKVKGLVQRLARRIPTIDDIRTQAKSVVDAKVVGTLTAQNYLRAEQRAANAAIEVFNKGDVQEAFDQKQRELLNHELFRAAADAQDFVDKAAKYMRRFDDRSTRQRLGQAGGPYLDQIDDIRERFDFAKISERQLSKRESLRAFIESKQAEGLTPDIPDYVLDGAFRKNFRELTVEQLRGVYQSARQIEHLARTKNKLLASSRGRAFEETKTSIVDRIKENFKITLEPPDYAPGLMKRTGRAFSKADAQLTRMEFLFKYLDGHKANGPAWNALLKPIQDAENVESARFRQAQRAMSDIFEKAYTKGERALFWWKKYDVKELGTSLTKPSLLAIALNHGNEGNREALFAGHEKFGWTEAGVQAALNLLDKRDWDTVQRIWDHLESYWPEVARLEKRMTGLEPEKVKATPVMTSYGEYRGGYYPIMFDKEVSWKQASIEAESNTKDLFGGSWVYAMTKHGHTKERVGTGGKPLLLTLSPLTNHLANVIHDLSYRPAVIDVNRIVSSPEVRGAIEGSVGRDMYAQLHPWLVSIAREKRGDYANALESLIARGRQGATIVHIGWRMTTALVHIPNYTVTLKELGPKYAAKGMADMYANPIKVRQQYRFVTATSPFMKERFETFDRDIRDQMSRMNVSDVATGPLSALSPYVHPAAMRASFFHLIHAAIMGGSLPTWMGGYRKALDGHVGGIEGGDLEASRDYADSLVREVWSAGSIKDLAALQRGSESWRAFTMFYTFMGTVYNQMKKTGQEYKLYGNFPKLVAGAALVWFVPAAMSQLLIGRGPSDMEDPEEWAKWLVRTEAEWPLSTIPIVRDIANPIIKGKGDYYPSAAFDIPKTLVKVSQSMEKKVADDTEFSKKDWENAFDTAGYFLQLPTKQLWLTLESMFEYMTGEKQVENLPTDIFHSLISQAQVPKEQPTRVASTAPLLGELRQQYLR